jgi:dihydrofolate reductase
VADLIYTTNVSLDGFIEDASGSLDFTEPDDEVFAFITELERPAGTYLYGRRLYESMAVWETDPAFAAQSDLMARFATMWQAADKVVHSSTLQDAPTARTRIVRDLDPDAVRSLKVGSTGHITIGGADLARQAFDAGLVDECRLFVHPVLLGAGKPVLPPGSQVRLELLGQHAFDSGTLYLRHRILR